MATMPEQQDFLQYIYPIILNTNIKPNDTVSVLISLPITSIKIDSTKKNEKAISINWHS